MPDTTAAAVGRASRAPAARAEAEASMALLDKALDTSKEGAVRLLDALPAADPAKGHRLDTYA